MPFFFFFFFFFSQERFFFTRVFDTYVTLLAGTYKAMREVLASKVKEILLLLLFFYRNDCILRVD